MRLQLLIPLTRRYASKIVAAILGAALFFCQIASADIYSYRDENGVVHFSSLPHLDKRYKLVYRVPIKAASNTAPGNAATADYQDSSTSQAIPPNATLSTKEDIKTNDPLSFGDRIPSYLTTSPAPNVDDNPHFLLWLFLAALVAGFVWKRKYFFGMPNVEQPKQRKREDGHKESQSSPPPQPAPNKSNWNVVLNLPIDASLDDIKRAYKALIGKYHPDKVASLGDELKELAEKKSQEINAAYAKALRFNGIEA